jgi:hypothetical protein
MKFTEVRISATAELQDERKCYRRVGLVMKLWYIQFIYTHSHKISVR